MKHVALAVVVAACSGKPAIDHDIEERRTGAAHEELTRLAKSLKHSFADAKAFPIGTTKDPLPHGNPEPGTYNGHCCGAKDASGVVVNKCQPDAAGWKADPIWSKLGFSIAGDSGYQFTYTGDAKSFTALAIGDLDCDTEMATFSLTGVVNASGDPEITFAMPPKGRY